MVKIPKARIQGKGKMKAVLKGIFSPIGRFILRFGPGILALAFVFGGIYGCSWHCDKRKEEEEKAVWEEARKHHQDLVSWAKEYQKVRKISGAVLCEGPTVEFDSRGCNKIPVKSNTCVVYPEDNEKDPVVLECESGLCMP